MDGLPAEVTTLLAKLPPASQSSDPKFEALAVNVLRDGVGGWEGWAAEDEYTWIESPGISAAQVRYLDCVGMINPTTDSKTITKFLITIEALYRQNVPTVVPHLLTGGMKLDRMTRIEANLCFMAMVNPAELRSNLTSMTRDDYILRLTRALTVHTEHVAVARELITLAQRRSQNEPIAEITPPILPIDDESMTPSQRLLEFYIREACTRNLRRKGGAVYTPVLLPDGTATRFFQYSAEISDWIFAVISPTQSNMDQFLALTARQNTPGHMASLLEKIVDSRFPTLKKCRTLFSYRNGVFDACTGLFHWYLHPDLLSEGFHTVYELDSTLSTSNFFDTIMPRTSLLKDAMSMETPNFDSILRSQRYSDNDMEWFYAMTGRLMHDVNAMDQWQCCLYIYGVASSGKSTLYRLFAEIYESSDVGFLADDSEQNFIDQHLINAFTVFCLDCSNDLRLPKTRFNSWVTGEQVVISQKFKTALTKTWSAPIVFASNSLPPIASTAGSGTRRFVIFPFDHVVSKIDTGLQDKCRAELPLFLIKCARLYLDKVAETGSAPIWGPDSKLPQMCFKAREKYSVANDPRAEFLLCSDLVEVCNGHSEKIIDLALAYAHWLSAKRGANLSNRDFSVDLLAQSLNSLNRPELRLVGATLHGIKLVGVFAS